MVLKITKTKAAVTPTYSHPTDAGLDLTAVSKEEIDTYIEYGTGISVEIPEGYVGLIFPRSSLFKKDLILSNSVGVIDSGYRGEIKFKFKRLTTGVNVMNVIIKILEHALGGKEDTDQIEYNEYEIGDRIGQLIVVPYVQIETQTVDKLSPSDRGTKGFGSTGR